MTLREFERKAIKAARTRLEIPNGWWGEWSDITNGVVRVKRNGLVWTIVRRGKVISRHDSRTFAIAKARRIK